MTKALGLAPTPTACRYFGCGGYAISNGFCKIHLADAPQREWRRFQDKLRATQQQWRKIYNTAQWRKRTRPAVLARDPICKMPAPYNVCQGRNPSTIAHHVQDHRGDWKLAFDMQNLIGVCKQCHDTATALMWGFGREPFDATKPPPVPDIKIEPLDTTKDYHKMLAEQAVTQKDKIDREN